jgi:hypothetical protein
VAKKSESTRKSDADSNKHHHPQDLGSGGLGHGPLFGGRVSGKDQTIMKSRTTRDSLKVIMLY